MSLHAALRELRSRTVGAIFRAVIHAVTDSTDAQEVQISGYDGELQDGVERFQEYGFSSVPPSGDTEAAIVNVGGNRSHGIVVATESRRYRPTGRDEGDVALYDTAGSTVRLRPDRSEIVIQSDGDVRINDGGGTAPGVARVGDSVEILVGPNDNPDWYTWCAGVGGGGTPGPPPSTPLVGTITTGSASVSCGG